MKRKRNFKPILIAASMLLLMKPCGGYGQTNADGTSNFLASPTSSAKAREVKKMALEMVRVQKLGKEQSEDRLKFLRQTGQQVLQEATKQKAVSISNPIRSKCCLLSQIQQK